MPIMMNINKFKRKKIYQFSPYGHVKMLWDIKQERKNKVNGIIGIAVIIGMFGLGFLSKEFVSLILVSKGIDKVASIMIG